MPGEYPFYFIENEQAYVRHRSRQIRQSIYEDIRHTLSVSRDFAGRLESDPNVDTFESGSPKAYAWLSDDPDKVMPLLGEQPLTFIDYFPEGGLAAYEKIATNTLALDNGHAEPEYDYELGGLKAQEWTFTFALNASTDAVAGALFQDINDRVVGRTRIPPQQELIDNLQDGDPIPEPFAADRITLYNFAAAPPIPITRMEVESFRFEKSDEEAAPGVQLFFAELVITDFVFQGS